MKIFVTGATGFIGSALTPQLIAAGHQVLGMTRSKAGEEKLRAAGAEPFYGDLNDLDSMRKGAAAADAVIHLAFQHDFANFVANCALDTAAVRAIGEVLLGSSRPFLVTSGVLIARPNPGHPATEDDPPVSSTLVPRAASEEAVDTFVQQGLRAAVVRLPQVHDTTRAGLISYWIPAARASGEVNYIGDGANRWAAAHVSDTAVLYRLAIEKLEPGVRYNAVGEEGIPAKDIAAVLARGLKLPLASIAPEQATAKMGFLGMFMGRDGVASSAKTQARLGWKPTGPGLLEDLERFEYGAPPKA